MLAAPRLLSSAISDSPALEYTAKGVQGNEHPEAVDGARPQSRHGLKIINLVSWLRGVSANCRHSVVFVVSARAYVVRIGGLYDNHFA